MEKRDNSTLRSKISLRNKLLKEIPSPVIMETHGGIGVLFKQCYKNIERGVVFEKNADKVVKLAEQRPTWSVYETDCIRAITGGVGSHLPVNFLDVDPHGTPLDTIAAIFEHWVYLPQKLALVVTDGQRVKAQFRGAWTVERIQPLVAKYGNDEIYSNYVELCEELIETWAATRGYKIAKWTGYYCGYGQDITHYAAILERETNFKNL